MIDTKLAPNIPFYNLRHLLKPEVTGWAQVTFLYGFSQEDSAEKLQYDLYYVKNKSLLLDLHIIIKTIKTVLTGASSRLPKCLIEAFRSKVLFFTTPSDQDIFFTHYTG